MNEVFIILFLILLNGVFSMSEIAMISARKSSLQSEAEDGNGKAKRALKLAGDPDKFLSTIQIGITLIGILTGIFSGNEIARSLGGVFEKWGVPVSTASGLAKTLIVIIVTYFSIVLGELVPKRIGMSKAEKVAKAMAGPMSVLSKIASPFIWILSKSTAGVAKMLGIKENDNNVTEDEIISLVQEGTEDGEVSAVEQDIVERVFTLGDLSVNTIMTSRQDIVWLDKTMTEAEVREVIEENIYEEYPVCDDDLDHVIGVLNIKDFLRGYGKDGFDLVKMMRDPVYFHENMTVYKVLEEMKVKRISRALVCDEFGSLCGFISLKDIMEALVGNVNDDEEEEPYIVPRLGTDGKPDTTGASGYLVEGQCPIYDFLSWEGFSFEVVDMDGPRIDKVLVHKIQQEPEEKESEQSSDKNSKSSSEKDS